MRSRSIAIGIVIASLQFGSVAGLAQAAVAPHAFLVPAKVPSPADNRLTPARIDLGKMLFFDPRLSGSGWISCSSCHNPALGWSDGLPKAKGEGMRTLRRATPTIVNAAFNDVQMWDGRFPTLEAQALGPMLSPDEMNSNVELIVRRLNAIPGYRDAFEKAYPGDEIAASTLARAIASFERTVISRNSPFDSWARGDEHAIDPSAKRGYTLFVGKASCVLCHSGPSFTDSGFHNIGLTADGDEGRYAKLPLKSMQGAFKTPTLRNIALTAPYMHNGEYTTLEEVVEHYDRGGDDMSHLDPNMRPLHLSPQEKKDLVEFLKSLTGRDPAVFVPVLPQ
jgi:cytochrome c peroxidase